MNQVLTRIVRQVLLAILPIVLTVALINLTVVPTTWEQFAKFLVGSAFIFAGFVLFLLGVETGLVPLGQFIGSSLVTRGSLPLLLGIGFAIGFAITAAEPQVRVLADMVAKVNPSTSSWPLVYTVALGVGLLTVVSFLRVLKEVSAVWVLLPLYVVAFILGFSAPQEFVPVAFDAGGVTTGPVAVPFILALNVGVVSALALRDRLAGSFGLVGLAAVGPVIAVLILSFWR